MNVGTRERDVTNRQATHGPATGRAASALVVVLGALSVPTAVVLGCGSAGSSPTSPPCDQSCKDDVAITALRDTMKLAFNLTLQGKPVGTQDASTPCPLGGSVQISGSATSNADQGTTSVNLTYVLRSCGVSQTETDPTQTYSVTLNGTAIEVGTLSAQPSSTTALAIDSTSMSLSGTVYAPPVPYDAGDCGVTLEQDGNDLSGTLCGRAVGASL
jgi:hypothetical protein